MIPSTDFAFHNQPEVIDHAQLFGVISLRLSRKSPSGAGIPRLQAFGASSDPCA
jgi:hypothetical protein